MHKIMVCYGTRPELIKLAPVIWQFQRSGFADRLVVVNTNQHTHTMCEAVLGVTAHHHLNVLSPNQRVSQLAAKISSRLDLLLQQLSADGQRISALIAQGDTITTLCAGQTAFFNKIPFHHVEAGLRSGDINSPFPEEYNRQTVSTISRLHFAPSELERENLLREGIGSDRIHVVGNTVYDALQHFYKETPELEKDTVLISIHRAANQQENLHTLAQQLVVLAKAHKQLRFVWLMHPNPAIASVVSKLPPEIDVRPNLSYPAVVELYSRCKMVITDSGGIMEESAFLGIPRIIARTDNERKGLLNLADTFVHDPAAKNLKSDFEAALAATGKRNFTYGTGNAAEHIVAAILATLARTPIKA